MKAIVVSFDHLPVGFLGLYGNTWVDTPAFDRLAAEGVVFDRHFAADTERVGEAWWTGGYDARTVAFVERPDLRGTTGPVGFDEVIEVTGEDGLDVPVAETPFGRMVLAASEWLTEAAASDPDGDWLLWLKSRGVPVPWLPPREFAERYVELFEELEEGIDEGAYDGDEEWELVEAAVEEEEDDAGDWDEEGYDFDNELPEDDTDSEADDESDVDEAAEFDELLVALASIALRETPVELEVADWLLVRAVYGGYVSLLDRGLAELCRSIELTVGEDVLLVVTGGAGESLGERAELPEECDALGLGEEVVHTPLLLSGPGILAGSRRQDLVRTTDLAPTLRDWFGSVAVKDGDGGRSLLPVARGEAAEDGPEAVVLTGPDGIRGYRTADRYLIADESGDAVRLFVKPDDVWDLHDVSGQEPGTVDDLLEALRSNL